MRKYIVVFSLIISSVVFGQNPEIKPDLPTVIPPSPTVSALMKFEEVPLSNYIGTPDISIPLFSGNSLSKNINLNLSLKYHPGNVKPESVASDTGLGWSLFAGGTVSRTVRGLPDEVYNTQDYSNGSGKIGLYHTQGNFKNNIYNRIFDYYYNGNVSQFDEYIFNEYLFDVADKNRMDTQYDLWQFNFMGKSGRFLIVKDVVNNILVVKNLDLAKEVEIKINYNATTFVVNSLEIYDNKGYKYIFDIIETTLNSTTITTRSFVPNNDPVSIIDEDDIFNSSFKLTKIYSPNNQLLIDFNYSQNANIEYTSSNTEEFSEPISLSEGIGMADYIQFNDGQCPGSVNSIGPKYSMTTQQIKVYTKKISSINIINVAKISFGYQTGRLDSKLIDAQNSLILKDLTVKDWNDNFIKKINLNYTYKSTMYNRLILESVEFQNNSQINNEKYSFEYKDLPDSYNGETFTKDAFGYLTIIPAYISNYYYNEVNPDYVTVDVLQKMVYPTKGSVVFDFQSNTYSYEGDVLLTNYNDNIKNWDVFNQTVNFSSLTSSYQNFFTISQAQDVYLTSTLNVTSSDFRFEIYKFENNTYTLVGGIDEATCTDGNCSSVLNNLSPGIYKVKFTSVDLNFPSPFNASIKAIYKQYNNTYQYNFGGGIRINKIGYFKGNVNKNTFSETNPEVSEKLMNYDYSNNNLSNGALVSIKPKFEYEYKLQKVNDRFCYSSPSCDRNLTPIFNLKKFTTYNNIKSIQTQGSDIGYSSVKVYENLKGYTKYEYTSPIEYPEIRNDFYPFLISENFDFKRGLLTKETTFDQSNKTLNQTTYNYQIDVASESERIYGLNFYVLNYNSNLLFYNPLSSYAGTYDVYFNLVFTGSTPCPFGFNPGSGFLKPIEYVNVSLQKEAYGWAKLTSKTTKNYFYPNGGTTPNIVQSNETFTYNSLNKQIASHTVDNSVGEILTTNYFYHTGNSSFTQNRISEIERIETKRGTELLSESKINYSNTFTNNQSYLPSSIEVKKGSSAFEVRLKNNAYDEFGHVLEVQQESGIKISYIYGYNQSQPIAKIENASYADVQPYVSNLQTLSNGTNEGMLITALNDLRINLPDAMVTTITYKPLIGVSTMTDPKGDKITYHYDSFNRLEFVKDKDGNILSENNYHYKN